MKKVCTFLVIALLASFFSISGASAVDTGSPDFDGYIIKLKPNTVSLLSSTVPAPVYTDKGIYQADYPSQVIPLIDSGLVEYVEPNYHVRLMDISPNDIFRHEQWNLDAIEANCAWEGGFIGTGVRIAVIDSGINTFHEDFAGAHIETGMNLINGGVDTSDSLGHGTAVAGIIAAATNNIIGVSGIADGAVIVPLKCFKDSYITNVTYIISAVYNAIDTYDCDIINLSLGIEYDINSLHEAVNYAEEKQVIVISSVGNFGTEQFFYPAAYDTVIGVGSVSQDGMASYFSQRNSSVTVVAPGENIITLSAKDNFAYESASGTSYATPHVAAAAAIAVGRSPELTPSEFRQLIIDSASKGDNHLAPGLGHGLISIQTMLKNMDINEEAEAGELFSDISGHWAEASIISCAEAGLVTGDENGMFTPDGTIDRSMFVTMLARVAGTDTSTCACEFSDVSEDDWFYGSVAWGVENGLITGNGDGTFTPCENISRQQMAALLYRYAIWQGLLQEDINAAVLERFTDSSLIEDWAVDSMIWAVQTKVVSGSSETTLSPLDTATRAEAAALIMNFIRTILPQFEPEIPETPEISDEPEFPESTIAPEPSQTPGDIPGQSPMPEAPDVSQMPVPSPVPDVSSPLETELTAV